MWIFVHLLPWPGSHWDFARGLLSIPEDKISVFLASVREVSRCRIVTGRAAGQFTGRYVSFWPYLQDYDESTAFCY